MNNASTSGTGSQGSFVYNRLSAKDTAILIIDEQVGLANGIRDQPLSEFFDGLRALVRIADVFKLPVVISTSAETGPNGPTIPLVFDILPKAKVIRRPGQINAWDNQDFVTAVTALGVKNLVIAGISTDVCLTFVSLSAKAAGYNVYAVVDASGTFSSMMSNLAI
jgi:nicotinamidase-related amidase